MCSVRQRAVSRRLVSLAFARYPWPEPLEPALIELSQQRPDAPFAVALPRPVDEGIVHRVTGETAQPLVPVRGDDKGHVGPVARPQTPGDGELHRAVQLLALSDLLEPLDRHLRVPAVGAPAAAPLAEHQLGERLTFRGRRVGHRWFLA